MRDFIKREDVVLATKFFLRTAKESEQGISGLQHIENMIDTSLKNLGMDYIDLYICHMWDWQTPIEDILDGLNKVVKQDISVFPIASLGSLLRLMPLPKEKGAKFVSVQDHL